MYRQDKSNEPTNEGAPIICTFGVPIHLSFNSQHEKGPPLFSPSGANQLKVMAKYLLYRDWLH
jgi:hypothetical protein